MRMEDRVEWQRGVNKLWFRRIQASGHLSSQTVSVPYRSLVDLCLWLLE
jgi:hypothetical protein